MNKFSNCQTLLIVIQLIEVLQIGLRVHIVVSCLCSIVIRPSFLIREYKLVVVINGGLAYYACNLNNALEYDVRSFIRWPQ